MVVEEINRDECIGLLTRNRLGHLACAQDGQPYVVPLSYTCDGRYLYAVSTEGQKIVWLRKNPSACVEVDEISAPDRWATVVVQGLFQELSKSPELHEARMEAYQRLSRDVSWWQGAYGDHDPHDPHGQLEPVYFRISIDTITGRRARA
jgi:nitroimidazol reductase NimA-like FMN-containing flavoprotein (pyridoxamine 5'-phosphate oxidase superfamily)